MAKWNAGNITSNDMSKNKDIIVNMNLPDVKDLAIAAGLIIGGIYHLCKTSFEKGAVEYLNSETKTLIDLGIMKNVSKAEEKALTTIKHFKKAK
jgi:hypothetical protein